jgi:glucosamine-6-phosphate deaminase
MRVILLPTADDVSRRAAQFVAQLVRRRKDCVLGLATGTSPLGIYRELIRLHREEGLDFSEVTTFNLDEYVGLGPTHVQSYRYFMQQHLFDHVNLSPHRTHVPDGRTLDFANYGARYEQLIRDAGGIDLQILGIGTDGHIAFNEPGSSLGSRTRVKTLAPETRRDNARFFENEDQVPRLSITMGVGTILEAKTCLLVAMGASKARAISETVEGPVTAQVTASALQLHRDVITVVDDAAGALLARRDYYRKVEEAQTLLEQGNFAALGLGNS